MRATKPATGTAAAGIDCHCADRPQKWDHGSCGRPRAVHAREAVKQASQEKTSGPHAQESFGSYLSQVSAQLVNGGN